MRCNRQSAERAVQQTAWTSLCWRWLTIYQHSFQDEIQPRIFILSKTSNCGFYLVISKAVSSIRPLAWKVLLRNSFYLSLSPYLEENGTLLGECGGLSIHPLHWTILDVHVCLSALKFSPAFISGCCISECQVTTPGFCPTLVQVYIATEHSLQTSFCHLNPACDEVFFCLHSHWSQAKK